MTQVEKIEIGDLTKGGSVTSHGAGIYSYTSEYIQEFQYDFSSNKVTENSHTELTDSQINEIIDEIESFIEQEKPDYWADEDPYRAETIYSNY